MEGEEEAVEAGEGNCGEAAKGGRCGGCWRPDGSLSADPEPPSLIGAFPDPSEPPAE